MDRCLPYGSLGVFPTSIQDVCQVVKLNILYNFTKFRLLDLNFVRLVRPLIGIIEIPRINSEKT